MAVAVGVVADTVAEAVGVVADTDVAVTVAVGIAVTIACKVLNMKNKSYLHM